jgi:hypothetical protein
MTMSWIFLSAIEFEEMVGSSGAATSSSMRGELGCCCDMMMVEDESKLMNKEGNKKSK